LDCLSRVRYHKCFGHVVQGDFGYSFRSRSPVLDLIKMRLPTTLYVIGRAYLISILIAIPIGVLSAVKQYSVFDNVATTIAFIGFSLPTFFTGLLLIIVFSVKLGWLPSIYRSTINTPGLLGVWERVEQAIMPIAVLALLQSAPPLRSAGPSMLRPRRPALGRRAGRTGRPGRALSPRRARRSALLRGAATIAPGVPAVFTGAVGTEQISRVPGLGSW